MIEIIVVKKRTFLFRIDKKYIDICVLMIMRWKEKNRLAVVGYTCTMIVESENYVEEGH